MTLKINLCHHKNKLDFKIHSNRNTFFKIIMIFHNITVFTVFCLNKYSLVSVIALNFQTINIYFVLTVLIY